MLRCLQTASRRAQEEEDRMLALPPSSLQSEEAGLVVLKHEFGLILLQPTDSSIPWCSVIIPRTDSSGSLVQCPTLLL